jgi:uncharacterized membrane protein YcjF (UPF0283 family)
MPSLDQFFAYAVAILAGVAVLGALLFAISWEWFAFRRLLERHRKPDPYEQYWRSQRALAGPK